jgi:hypothetical protein
VKNGENPTYFVKKSHRRSTAAIFSAQENHLSGFAVYQDFEISAPPKIAKDSDN